MLSYGPSGSDEQIVAGGPGGIAVSTRPAPRRFHAIANRSRADVVVEISNSSFTDAHLQHSGNSGGECELSADDSSTEESHAPAVAAEYLIFGCGPIRRERSRRTNVVRKSR